MSRTARPSSKLSDALAKSAIPRPAGPIWAGPAGGGPNGGVTQSLLGRYLSCKERFRVYAIEGWKTADKFSPPMDFGNMWHTMEEAHAAGTDPEKFLVESVEKLREKYPFQQDEITLWAEKALSLFPRYVEHWRLHPDVIDRTPLLQEQVFDVPYQLPSGRSIRLRGKWDSVDLIGRGKGSGIYIQENKTKSQIDQGKVQGQLRFDLQTMLYMIALQAYSSTLRDRMKWEKTNYPAGVRYNVVRRAAHKSVESMMKKFEEDREDHRIGEWFARWKVEISAADVTRFKTQCLDPVLENLLDDYEWWNFCITGKKDNKKFDQYTYLGREKVFPHHTARHFRLPYGIYSPVAEGGFGDVDYYLEDGSTIGLKRVESLFPELGE
jgi:hypothetical protein